MKKKYNRIWTLALVSMLSLSCSLPVRASIADSTQTIQQDESSSDSAEQIPAAFLYAELSEDQLTQNVVIKLDSECTPDSAVLFSEVSGNQEETSAFQIIENYISFSLPASENRTFQKIDFSVDDTEYTTSLLPLENGTQLDQEDFEEALNTEPAAATFSLDEESSEIVDNCVITTTLNDEIDTQELAVSVASTLSLQTSDQVESLTSSNQKKVIVLDPGHGSAGTGTYRNWGDFVIDEAIINYKITTYTKEALEANYANIAVYTTKVSQNENPSLENRVRYAVDKQADIFVSQHVNATGETVTSASGVLAMVPKLDASHDYHHDAAQASLDMAQSILNELTKLGFKNMGFQERLTENSSKYPDGSYADYYGIVKHCRINNLPGVIIEHGFANNWNDALKLNSESMLKQIGEADAKGIASYLNLSSGTSAPPTDNTGVAGHTFLDNSSNTSSGWKYIDNKWYYYDANGKMTTGWQKVNGVWYYMDSNGVMQTGWLELNGKKYYLTSSGAMATGWLHLDNNWYFLDASGAMITGWQKVNGTWYYMDSNGVMLTGWLELNDKKYYLTSSGAMATGWLHLDNNWYFLDASGAMITGWQKVNNIWYYLDSSGVMLTGWQTINDTWYYMNSSGAMLTGWQKVNGTWYYMNGSGAMLTGWQKINGIWYYLDSSGAMLTGWLEDDDNQYYLDDSGAMLIGTHIIDGKTYTFSSSGALIA
ncbi:MAG: N-acetylmuramoyl-L-alanine amidase [Oliverpabstia sp.]